MLSATSIPCPRGSPFHPEATAHLEEAFTIYPLFVLKTQAVGTWAIDLTARYVPEHFGPCSHVGTPAGLANCSF